jgi:TRAP-type uncharacterized transport system substrate-binding protein
MRSKVIWQLIVVVVAIAGVGSIGWRSNAWNFSPTQTVRIATMPLSDSGKKFFSALKHEITAAHAGIQLSLIEAPDAGASAQALQEQKADAAVIRSDDPSAADARTIFVLRNLYVALLVPASSSVDAVSKLKGKKIAVLTKDGMIDPMAKVVLDFYGIDAPHVVQLGSKELAPSLQHKHVAAVMVVGSTGAGPIAEAVDIFHKATKRLPKFLDLSEASTIANRFAIYDEAEISVGAFGGSPPVPAEKVTTISANLLLVSRPSLSNYVAGELTRLSLATKAKVATSLPEAGQLAAPSTDNDDLLLAHPGTIAFLNGSQSSFFDDPTNVILLASMLFGLLGSLAAWLRALGKKTKSQEIKRRMCQLPVLLEHVKVAGPEQLDDIENELARLSEWALQKFMADQISLEEFQKVETRVGHLSMLVQKQRAAALAEVIPDAAKPKQIGVAKPARAESWDGPARSSGDLYCLPNRCRERDATEGGGKSDIEAAA